MFLTYYYITMETKTSKIKEIISKKERKGDKWTVYYFTVEMENGDKYPIKKGKMKEDGFTVGQELHYTIDKDWEYDKIFIIEEQKANFGGGTSSKSSNASFAMSYAKDLCVAGVIKVENLTDYAWTILAWLSNN